MALTKENKRWLLAFTVVILLIVIAEYLSRHHIK